MARIRMSKAQKAQQVQKAVVIDSIRVFAGTLNEVQFTFPDVKGHARVAHDALVDLSAAIMQVGQAPKQE